VLQLQDLKRLVIKVCTTSAAINFEVLSFLGFEPPFDIAQGTGAEAIRR
jgi:hypothetical protein